MANDEELEEIRQQIQEEREAKRKRVHQNYLDYRASGGYDAAMKRRMLKRDKAQHAAEEAARYLRKMERKAGRPKPTACEVCSNTDQRIVYDHHHGNNVFRGWLCIGCNIAVGAAREDPTILEKLAVYMRRSMQ